MIMNCFFFQPREGQSSYCASAYNSNDRLATELSLLKGNRIMDVSRTQLDDAKVCEAVFLSNFLK